FPDYHKPMIIGDYSLISSGCIITPYANIGKYAVVHSGAVVLKDLPEKAVFAEEKAKIVYILDIDDKKN
ncbi:MAG: acyltransferase, partial [bacterium]